MKSKAFWWTCVALWCALIFYLSSNTADESSNLSLFIATLLNDGLKGLFGTHALFISEFAVRKTAHFVEFLVLGCLLFMAFFDRSRPGRSALFVFAAGLLFAVSDELHQFFVPGRAMHPFDVVIDTLGIAAAVAIMSFGARAWRKKPR